MDSGGIGCACTVSCSEFGCACAARGCGDDGAERPVVPAMAMVLGPTG